MTRWPGWTATAALVAALTGCGGGGTTTSSSTSAALPTSSTTPRATTLPRKDAGRKGAGAVGAAPSDEDNTAAIEQTIAAVLAGTDPDDRCAALVTPAYVAMTYGSERGCREAPAEQSRATDIRFLGVSANGDRATAVIVVSGGVLDGERPTVNLVLNGGIWKVDSLTSNVAPGP